MTGMNQQQAYEALGAFVGEWSLAVSFAPDQASATRARTTFEWLTGRRFLVQRWEVDHPDAPDGIAIIGSDRDDRCDNGRSNEATYLQHYFDSRGVARVYEMGFDGRMWTLLRLDPGFSQRFTGTFSDDGTVIHARWEKSMDGSEWEHDFDMTYTKVR